MTRKTLYTAQDENHFLRMAFPEQNNGLIEQGRRKAARYFLDQLADAGFTTHADIVREFMMEVIGDQDAVFAFCRLPESTDTAVLCGGHAHGTVVRNLADRKVIETLHYGAVSFAGSEIRPTRHYYRIAGLNVATGMWEFHHESL